MSAAEQPPTPRDHGPWPGREHLALAAIAVALSALPFLLVEFAPIHDLPHHLAQARHLSEIDDPTSSPYRVQWLAPQNLIYVLLVPLWWILPPVAAGSAFAWLLLAGTIVAPFVVAWSRGREATAALLAGLFAYNFLFYSGFFAFQLGGILFFVWLTTSREIPDRRTWVAQALLVAALAWAHALWFGAVGLLLLIDLAKRRGARASWIRLATVVLPSLWLAPQLLGVVEARAEGGFPVEPMWMDLSFRLSWVVLVHGTFGGLRGGVEPLLVLGVLAWIAAALVTNRGRLRQLTDGWLLTAAGALVSLWLVFPDTLAMTIQASRRWLPYAAMLTVLGLPRPRLSLPLLRSAAVAAHVVLLVATGGAWRQYDRVDLSGFREAIDALPAGADLLGLSFLESERLHGGVFLQTFAWAEVLRGAELNMSFTELGAGLVLRKEPRETPWTFGLNFFPHTVRPSDFRYFDHVLVSGPEEVHEQIERMDGIDAVTHGAPWRLYSIQP